MITGGHANARTGRDDRAIRQTQCTMCMNDRTRNVSKILALCPRSKNDARIRTSDIGHRVGSQSIYVNRCLCDKPASFAVFLRSGFRLPEWPRCRMLSGLPCETKKHLPARLLPENLFYSPQTSISPRK